MDRLNKYKEFMIILKKVPVIKKILRLYTSNILAPDDITKVSLKTVPKDPTINKLDEEYSSIEAKYRMIMDRINIEDHLYNIVFKLCSMVICLSRFSALSDTYFKLSIIYRYLF